MKVIPPAIIVFLVILLLGNTASQAHAGGCAGSGVAEEIHKIGSSTNLVLQNYLTEEYQHNCQSGKDKSLSEACHVGKAIYASETLPGNVIYKYLPKEVLKNIGFVPPGVAYVQIGYTVYLIGWPRKVIYDSVTLEEKLSAT